MSKINYTRSRCDKCGRWLNAATNEYFFTEADRFMIGRVDVSGLDFCNWRNCGMGWADRMGVDRSALYNHCKRNYPKSV